MSLTPTELTLLEHAAEQAAHAAERADNAAGRASDLMEVMLEVKSQVQGTAQKCEDLDRRVTEHQKVLHGNGQTGLVSKLTEIVARLDAGSTERAAQHRRLTLLVAILGVLIALGSFVVGMST